MAQVKGAGHVVSSSERSRDTLVNGIRVEDCLMQILTHTAMCLVAQACPTLCDPMDCSPSVSSVHGILQEYWSGLPFHSPWDFPDPGIKHRSPALQTDSLLSEPPEKPPTLL